MEFCTSKNCTPHPVKSRELVPDSILRLYLVAKICRWKAEIHKAFEGCKAFQPWNFQPKTSQLTPPIAEIYVSKMGGRLWFVGS